LEEIEGKRLLFLGGTAIASDIVETARKMGVYTIVTDYLENSPAKRIADESHMTSTTDIDAVVRLCKDRGVDGIFAGYFDSILPTYYELCSKLGFPCYGTKEQFERASDKRKFKEMCIKHHVPVIDEFCLDERLAKEQLNQIRYPVIVKPVDNSGSRGISVCRNEDELKDGYKKALSFSGKKEVIIEKYIIGDEIGLNYFAQNGSVELTAMYDRYLEDVDNAMVRLPLAYVFPSKYFDQFLENEHHAVRRMFMEENFKNGPIFLQGCVEDKRCHLYEMGYRFNGAKQYQIVSKVCGFNTSELMIRYALTGTMGSFQIKKLANPAMIKHCCTLSLLIKPGKIKKIIGLDAIAKIPQVAGVVPWYFDGDTLGGNALGTQQQIAARISIAAETKDELASVIHMVNERFNVLSDNDESLLLPLFDVNRLF